MKPIIFILLWLSSCFHTFSFAQGLEVVPKAEYERISPPPIVAGAGELKPIYVIPNSAFPRPQNQGNYLSCVGWAVGYYIVSYYQARKQGYLLDNEARFYSPSYLYNQIRRCEDCTKCGSRMDYALDWAKYRGVVPLNYYPATNCNRPPYPPPNGTQLAHIDSWNRLQAFTNLNEIKRNLLNDIPVLVTINVSLSFKQFKNKTENDTYVWKDREEYEPHAIIVVGYDEKRRAFRLLNSHGIDWGVGGYGWVAYDSFKDMILEGYIVIEESNMRPVEVAASSLDTTISNKNFVPYAYKEKITANRNHYTIGLKVDEAVVDRIKSVLYLYNDSSFVNKQVRSTTPPVFTTSYTGWDCVENIEALVQLKDGTTLRPISINVCSLLNDGLTTSRSLDIESVTISPVVTATRSSRKFYDFKIDLRGLDIIKTRIEKVTYFYNHETFKQKRVTTRDIRNNFAGGYRGWGCLSNVDIEVFFDNNTSRKLSVNMCEQLGW